MINNYVTRYHSTATHVNFATNRLSVILAFVSSSPYRWGNRQDSWKYAENIGQQGCRSKICEHWQIYWQNLQVYPTSLFREYTQPNKYILLPEFLESLTQHDGAWPMALNMFPALSCSRCPGARRADLRDEQEKRLQNGMLPWKECLKVELDACAWADLRILSSQLLAKSWAGLG